ncbi:MAG: phage holin family protein [Desulfobacterales bacterium]|nr:phage holin family protein [Desulfobacterales bacterium]
MMILFIKWVVLTIAVLATSYLFDGIQVTGFLSALSAAAILGLLNTFFRPFLLIITLPINMLSMGLFTFVINALMLVMASGVIPGFHVSGFWSAVFGSLMISIVNWALSSFVQEKGIIQKFDELQRKNRRFR